MNYDTNVSVGVVSNAVNSLKEHNINSITVETGAEALAKIKELIPAGSSVVNGASKTLEQIGYIEYLKGGEHGWNNLHEKILNKKDPVKQAQLRKESVISDYYLGSAHAVTETGELVVASATGSQLPSLAFTSQNILLVVGTQKIVPTLSDAMDRLETYVFPLEDARMKGLGAPGSNIAKILIIKKEPAFMKRNFTVIFVNEKLGF